MLTSIQSNRRRHDRQAASFDCLVVAGRPATLVDWSFGGLALRLEDPTDLAVSEDVSMSVFDPATGNWEVLTGRVRRIDDGSGTVGISFADDGEASVRILIRLLGSRKRGLTM